jgi:hypothetical protein
MGNAWQLRDCGGPGLHVLRKRTNMQPLGCAYDEPRRDPDSRCYRDQAPSVWMLRRAEHARREMRRSRFVPSVRRGVPKFHRDVPRRGTRHLGPPFIWRETP